MPGGGPFGIDHVGIVMVITVPVNVGVGCVLACMMICPSKCLVKMRAIVSGVDLFGLSVPSTSAVDLIGNNVCDPGGSNSPKWSVRL